MPQTLASKNEGEGLVKTISTLVQNENKNPLVMYERTNISTIGIKSLSKEEIFFEKFPNLKIDKIREFRYNYIKLKQLINNMDKYSVGVIYDYSDDDELEFLKKNIGNYSLLDRDNQIQCNLLKDFLVNHNIKNDIIENFIKLPLNEQTKLLVKKNNYIYNVKAKINIVQTIFDILCPSFALKAFNNFRMNTLDNPFDKRIEGKVEFFKTKIFLVETESWDEFDTYTVSLYNKKNDNYILIADIGYSDYRGYSLEDIKDEISLYYLNILVGEILYCYKVVDDLLKKRVKMHCNYKTNNNKEEENEFFGSIFEEYFDTNINIPQHKINKKSSEIKEKDNLLDSDIKKALGVLGINTLEKLTQKKVREISKELLFKNHPDKTNNSAENNQITKQVIESRKILINYLKGKRDSVTKITECKNSTDI